MSIIRAAARLMIRAHGQYHFEGPVLSLGVPDVYATSDDLDRWFPELASMPSLLAKGDTVISSNKIGKRLGYVSGRSFFHSFGFSEVDSLDIPGCEHPAEIEHDLNNPLPDELHGKYGLVVDPGTLEHVFDQRTCFENIARALKVGGVVAHFVPVYSYNGGYYSINPNVVSDFYNANGFGEVTAYLLMWDRYRAMSRGKTRCYVYGEDVLGSRHALADLDQVRYTPHLMFFARKLEQRDTYICPLQFEGNYVTHAAALPEARNQALEVSGKKWAALAHRLLPFRFAFYLQMFVYRWLVFLRARRNASFWI